MSGGTSSAFNHRTALHIEGQLLGVSRKELAVLQQQNGQYYSDTEFPETSACPILLAAC
jgi:hypothetical protein